MPEGGGGGRLNELAAAPNEHVPALLYLALVTTAVAQWLQAIGQSRVNAQDAAVIYALGPSTPRASRGFCSASPSGRRGSRGWRPCSPPWRSAGLLVHLPPGETFGDVAGDASEQAR